MSKHIQNKYIISYVHTNTYKYIFIRITDWCGKISEITAICRTAGEWNFASTSGTAYQAQT